MLHELVKAFESSNVSLEIIRWGKILILKNFAKETLKKFCKKIHYRRGTHVWDSWTDLFSPRVKTSIVC